MELLKRESRCLGQSCTNIRQQDRQFAPFAEGMTTRINGSILSAFVSDEREEMMTAN